MSRLVSPSTGQVYGLQRVTRVWGVSRATVYRHRHPEAVTCKRPGPLGPMADEALAAAIRQLLADSPLHGEGYRKLWARLRFAGIRTSRVSIRCGPPCEMAGGEVDHGPAAGLAAASRLASVWQAAWHSSGSS